MGQLLQTLGLAALIVIILVYLVYCVGLSLVFRRLKRPPWRAYVPGLNYYTLITTLGFPGRWTVMAVIPYVGSVYVVAIALRLGQVFHRGRAWSVTWLTVGAALGMFVIARNPPNRTVLAKRPSLHLPKLKRQRSSQSA